MWTYHPLCATVENAWRLVCIPVSCELLGDALLRLLSDEADTTSKAPELDCTDTQTLFPPDDWCRLEQVCCLFWASHEHLSFNKLLQTISEQKGLPLALKCLCGEKPPLKSTYPEFCVCCMTPIPLVYIDYPPQYFWFGLWWQNQFFVEIVGFAYCLVDVCLNCPVKGQGRKNFLETRTHLPLKTC